MAEPSPRGSNTPDAVDYAKQETDRLRVDYADLLTTVDELKALADAIPDEITVEDKETVIDLVKRGRDVKIRIDGLHDLEKQPHLRRGQGSDNFFFGLWDRIMKREKKNRDGFVDELLAKLTALDVRLLAEEQARRRRDSEESARVEAKLREEADAAAKVAEDARLAAERARKPETTAAKQEIADAAESVADAAVVDVTVAAAVAETAYVHTLARPADIMRTRTASGTLGTMAQETYAEVEDATKLDMAKLWPYLPFAAKETALRAWAKSTGHNEQMPGAKIGRRPKSQVR